MKTATEHKQAIGAALAALDAAVLDMGVDYVCHDVAGRAEFPRVFSTLPFYTTSGSPAHRDPWSDLAADVEAGTVREFLPSYFPNLRRLF